MNNFHAMFLSLCRKKCGGNFGKPKPAQIPTERQGDHNEEKENLGVDYRVVPHLHSWLWDDGRTAG